jgi:hypothetical protein
VEWKKGVLVNDLILFGNIGVNLYFKLKIINKLEKFKIASQENSGKQFDF